MLNVSGLETYYGRAHILSKLSLEVARGEVVVLLGRNGAGKSTTLKSIMGLVRPRSGKIVFKGQDITRLPAHTIARLGLGYVPEERRVFSELSIRENLEVGRQPPRPDAPHWTLEQLFALFPNLAELQQRPAGQTSGGEQQMLSIARTLMGQPNLILLDEPSEGLAPVIVSQMAQTIHAFKEQGLSILLSEQNLAFATHLGDRAYIIEQGRIRYHGSMVELAADRAVRKAYLSV